MLKLICLALLPAIFLGCQPSATHSTGIKNRDSLRRDTLRYESKSLERKDKECTEPDSSKCAVWKVDYLKFEGHPVLNDSIIARLCAVYPVLEPAGSLQAQAERFIQDFEDFKKEFYPNHRGYELQSTVSLVENTAALISLKTESYMYLGGAHGSTISRFLNYDVKAGKVLQLEDVLIPGYTDSLTRIGERIFRANEELKAEEPLTGYFFTGNRFALNSNYAFTKKGILFLYNQYEIKPYAGGQTKLLIPYPEMKGLIREGSVLNIFLNEQ